MCCPARTAPSSVYTMCISITLRVSPCCSRENGLGLSLDDSDNNPRPVIPLEVQQEAWCPFRFPRLRVARVLTSWRASSRGTSRRSRRLATRLGEWEHAPGAACAWCGRADADWHEYMQTVAHPVRRHYLKSLKRVPTLEASQALHDVVAVHFGAGHGDCKPIPRQDCFGDFVVSSRQAAVSVLDARITAPTQAVRVLKTHNNSLRSKKLLKGVSREHVPHTNIVEEISSSENSQCTQTALAPFPGSTQHDDPRQVADRREAAFGVCQICHF